MESSKLDTLLNLSLSVTEQERMQSGELGTGFSPATGTWELIVKYNGQIKKYEQQGILVEELIAGYGIVTIQEELIPVFVEYPEIEYVEMPKRLFYAVAEGKTASCFSGVENIQSNGSGLTGDGVLVAVIDSGECVKKNRNYNVKKHTFICLLSDFGAK